MKRNSSHASVALFIPCLVDQAYPEIGLAMAHVLRRAGVRVEYDARQTCCGQPAFNAGFRHEALQVAGHFLNVFAEAGNIIAPSGSCVAMVRNFYPMLFRHHGREREARQIGERVFEFSEFLVQRLGLTKLGAAFPHKVGFHDSCHSYRELRLHAEPLSLLREVQGLELVVPSGEPVCCGFGGLFSVKFAPIAAAMTNNRLEAFAQAGAEVVVSNDPGCIMQMRKEARSCNSPMRILHLAEVLNHQILPR